MVAAFVEEDAGEEEQQEGQRGAEVAAGEIGVGVLQGEVGELADCE